MEISRETFKSADNSTQNLALFDSIEKNGKQFELFVKACDAKHAKIDEDISKAKRIGTAFSAAGGVVGGFLSAIGLKFLGS